jgi:ferredoxin-NADP reductase
VVIAVDEVPEGEVSPYLVRSLEVGDELEVRGPLGRFFVWLPSKESEPAPVQLIAGGSGIVPLFAMAAAHDRHYDGSEFRLLYSVRTSADVYFRAELDALAHASVDLNYTRESDDNDGNPPGRLTREKLSQLTLAPESRPRIFVCGPTSFVEAASKWLVELGHDPMTIRTERFGGLA